jgi:hypothetical protein
MLLICTIIVLHAAAALAVASSPGIDGRADKSRMKKNECTN